jgi:hypothetical protein
MSNSPNRKLLYKEDLEEIINNSEHNEFSDDSSQRGTCYLKI